MENRKLRIENELKPYDEYKETGLLWLDKVPKHWEIKSNKYLWAERKTVNCIDEQLLSVTIKKGIISQSELLKSSSKKDSSNLDKIKYKLVMPNDIAYNKMRMWQGAVGVSNYRGIVSPAYIVLKSRKSINSRYYHFLLRTPIYIEESHRNSYGICDDQLSLRYEDFKCMQNIIPPKEEQDQIVSYLDSKLSKINKFIKAKKKQIELLKELKQAIINQAVTKGLDPNAKMEPSGIEWLGDIPEGWEVVKLKFLSNKPLMYGANESGIDFSLDLPRYIRITDIDLDGSLKASNKLSLPRDMVEEFLLADGDVLFARSGATVGKTFLYKEEYGECCFAGYLIKFSPNKNIVIPEFLYFFTLSGCYKLWLNQIFIQATIQNVSAEKYKEISIALPSIDEQKTIIKYIETKTQTIDKTIEAIKKEISLITEYRTSLISNVVTGKVDVRHIGVEDAIQGLEEDLEDLEEENIDEEIEMGEEE